jgi:hypothetical protein
MGHSAGTVHVASYASRISQCERRRSGRPDHDLGQLRPDRDTAC